MDTLENTQTRPRTRHKHTRRMFFFLGVLVLSGAIAWAVVFLYESPKPNSYPLPEGFELV